MTDDIHPSLKPNAADRAHDLLLALSSAVDLYAPGWGSAFGYIVGDVIPNRRDERFARYLTKLSRRLSAIEQSLERIRNLGDEGLALFEDGARESARATSDERIERIVEIVGLGVSSDENSASLAREMLALFASLSDAEVAALASYAGVQPKFSPPNGPSPDRAVLMEAMRNNQIALQLRTSRLVSAGVLEEPQVVVQENYALTDRSGAKLVKDRPRVTPLGRALLVEIGVLPRK
jgi:hypothetical protein